MNHFVKVMDTDGDTVILRPDEISSIVQYRGECDYYDYVVMKNGTNFQLTTGQLSFDCLVNHTQHAGVRVLG